MAIGAELTGGWSAAALFALSAADKLFAGQNTTQDQILAQLQELQAAVRGVYNMGIAKFVTPLIFYPPPWQVSAIAIQLNSVAAEVSEIAAAVRRLSLLSHVPHIRIN